MDDDDGFMTSDAEIDSEIEDTDVDGELGVWLDQLNSYTQEASPNELKTKLPAPQSHVTLTPKQVMNSFRCSILDGEGDQDLDLDAILGELCQLETQLTTQQTEINTSLKNVDVPNDSDVPKDTGHGERPKTKPKPPSPQKVKASDTNANSSPTGSKVNHRDSLAELESALDFELQDALSELSDLVGITFDSSIGDTSKPCDAFRSGSDKGQGQDTSFCQMPKSDFGLSFNSNFKPAISSSDHHTGNPSHIGANGHEYQDYSPDEVDSAFSDTASLPSSGSHVSVTTTSSQHSSGSSGTGSTGSSGMGGGTATVAMEQMFGFYESEDVKTHLHHYQESLNKLDLSPSEQAAKMKSEKVRIALEKIKEANIQKLFVRFHSEDGCSKSILVDEKMVVSQICDRLVAKNNVSPSIHWAVVEHLPDLYMERLVEDHELMVEPLLMWTRDSKNKLLFVQSPGKYHIFVRPEMYLTPEKREEYYNEAARNSLIQEYFSEESTRFPDIDGYLYLKAEGKKAWKKYYFVLRASGIYYSLKGKGKAAKDLTCLQKLDLVEVYTAVSWRKKYKAPTDYGFALKHSQIQKKAPKYIKYLCAEDQKTFSLWVTGIRMAKHGMQLLKNYKLGKKNLETWDSRDITPNDNFAEYLAKQNERNQEFAKEHQLRPRASICSSSTIDSEGISETDRQSICSNTSSERHGSISKIVVNGGDPNITPSRKLSDAGEGSSRRGSLPIIDEYRRRSTISTDHNQNREYKGSDEDLRPTKMVPNLPVTTQTTRQITDQNAASGTLKRRPSNPGIKQEKKNACNPNENRSPPPPNPNENRSPPPNPNENRSLPPPPPLTIDNGYNDTEDDFPLPPPPPELLSPPIVEEVAYSVSQSSGVYPQGLRIGGSLPNSPQKRPSIHAKPPVVAAKPGLGFPQSPQQHIYSTPHQPPHTSAPHYASPTHVSAGHRRISSSPAQALVQVTQSPQRLPPPPPRRSENTKLSIHGDSPQANYFINDLQRVLTQKQEWSRELGPEPSFPPTPPPHKPHPPSCLYHMDDEWLPPPPAELLVELHVARKKAAVPVPPKYNATPQFSPNRGQH